MADVPGIEAGRLRLQEGAERLGASPRRLAEELRDAAPKSDNARSDEGGYQIPRLRTLVRARG